MTEHNRRERLPVPAASVIRALPAIGKLMVTAKRAGATHERIGTIERVTVDDGWLVCSGAEHDSRMDPSAIATIIVDRTSIMGDQAYPRIDFLAADGECLFSVVGFGGLEPFDAALAPFGPGEALPEKPAEPRGERPEVDPEETGARPLNKARDSGIEISIGFSRKGTRWRGGQQGYGDSSLSAAAALALAAEILLRERQRAAVAGVAGERADIRAAANLHLLKIPERHFYALVGAIDRIAFRL